VNDMKSMLRHQGVEGTRRRYGVETSEFGRREYGGERTGEGVEMNGNKSEINRK
jgi:hypothetical protein